MQKFLLSIIVCLIAGDSLPVIPKNQAQSDNQPSVVKAVAATYPLVAIGARVSGSVIVEVRINAKGEVTSADAIEGHKLLRKNAEGAARRWVFVPANEKNAARAVRLTFEFILMPRDSSYADLLPVFMPPYRVEVRDTPGRVVAND